MSRGYKTDKRDGNENVILDTLRRFGFVSFDEVVKDITAIGARGFFQQCAENDGHDLRVWDEYGFFAVEVKNPDVPPSKRRLTAREKIMQHLCIAFGFPFYVWETVDDVVKTLNARRLDN